MSNPSHEQPIVNPVPGFQHPYPPPGQEHLTEQQQWTGPQPKPRKEKRFGWAALIVAFLAGLTLGYVIATQPVEQESGSFSQGTGYSAEPGDDADRGQEPSTVPEPSDSATTAAPPTNPKGDPPTMTRAQKEALEAAESYLDSGHFSKQGLLDQLKSEYGEGFGKKDAQFAIDHVKADYKAEAVEAAESYLDSGHFSKAELLDQLESKYGEGFTHAEATYAVDKVY